MVIKDRKDAASAAITRFARCTGIRCFNHQSISFRFERRVTGVIGVLGAETVIVVFQGFIGGECPVSVFVDRGLTNLFAIGVDIKNHSRFTGAFECGGVVSSHTVLLIVLIVNYHRNGRLDRVVNEHDVGS